ncbi:hypothetical protein CPC08DRAFT_685438 [Agrocybe pediades]|nr:hypothetical protein CPC08DRAFT_685438 [Agrocybe pediades]
MPCFGIWEDVARGKGDGRRGMRSEQELETSVKQQLLGPETYVYCRGRVEAMMATAICNDHASTDAVYIIDSKIKQYEKEILALKTQRNTYAPISRLPPELITRIFECCKEVESMPSRLQYQKPPRWIPCSHVCRLWRTIALNSPTLWTDLNFNHFTWIKETFVRSKMAALKVALDLIGTPDEVSKVQFVKHEVVCHGELINGFVL